jgi:hypothetical protein
MGAKSNTIQSKCIVRRKMLYFILENKLKSYVSFKVSLYEFVLGLIFFKLSRWRM